MSETTSVVRHLTVAFFLLVGSGSNVCATELDNNCDGDRICLFEKSLRYVPFHAWEGCIEKGNCDEATIEANVTPLSKIIDRLSRISYKDALQHLGNPHFLLLPGDKILQAPGYTDILIEKDNVGAVLWKNGECAPVMLLIRAPHGQVWTSLHSSGTICMKEGMQFPLPPSAYSCSGSRRQDKHCDLTYLLALPHPR